MTATALSVRAAARTDTNTLAIAGDVSWTYRELAIEVERLLHGMATQPGFAALRRVAFVAEPTPATVVLFWALVEQGICAVPLHPRWTASERASALDRLGVDRFVPSPGDFVRTVETTDVKVAGLRTTTRSEAGALVILHTSGSSGAPKAVVLSRRAIVAAASASAANLGWRSGDRWLLQIPLAHIGGLSVLTRCLLGRRTAVLFGRPRYDAVETRRVIEREEVTLVSIVPAMLGPLVATGPPPPSLRAVLVGGDSTPPALLAEATGRGWPALTTYGMTETCSQVTTEPYRDRGEPLPPAERGTGVPLPGVEVRLDDEEVLVRSPALFDGYLQPDGSLDRPMKDGWFATGDRGTFAGGRLHILGRCDDRIVSGGENVDPHEVEGAAHRSIPGLTVAVFGLPDPSWGQVVCAAFVGDLDVALVPRAFEALAPFKRPRKVFRLDALTHTSSGKVDRHAVAQTCARRNADWQR